MAKKEITFRMTRYKDSDKLFNVQRKYWFGWRTVSTCLYESEAEHYVRNVRDPVVKVL